MAADEAGLRDRWALILGASSGFGAATALALAGRGMHIFGVHLDTRSTLANARGVEAAIREQGRDTVFFNVNAADAAKRASVLDAIQERLHRQGRQEPVRVLLHSLAFGTLRPFVPADAQEAITRPQMEMTLDVMANSLVYWVQEMAYRGLLGQGSRVFAMTSAGASRVIPGYGAVSAAKAALEAHVRQLALELATRGIRVNGIRAGVTDTPAMRRIPGSERLLEQAAARNPSGRRTTPKDVAEAIAVLSDERTYWMTGGIIGIDGGEDITI